MLRPPLWRGLAAAIVALAAGLACSQAPGATHAPATATPTPRPMSTPIPGFDAEEYFGNKRIVVNVGYSPGGEYDTYARLVAAHLPKHLPADQEFVVRNVIGSDGARVFRETLVETAPEGLAVAVVHPRFIKRELVGDDVPDFDIDTVKILGTASALSDTSAMYAFKNYAQTWGDVTAKGREPRYGATAPGDADGIAAAFLELVGEPIRIIYNYDGTSEIAADFDKGELDISDRGNPDTARSLFPDWVEGRQITPLFHWGADPADDQEFTDYIVNDLGAEIPPHLFDVIRLTENQKDLFALTESINDRMNRLFVMHPDTPEHIYQIWVEAFRRTVADPAFIKAALLLGREVGYAGPEDMLVALENGKRTLQDPALREEFIILAGTAMPRTVALPAICRPGMWEWTKWDLDPIWSAIPSDSLISSNPRILGATLVVEFFPSHRVYEANTSSKFPPYVGEYPTLKEAQCAAAQAALRASNQR